MKLHTQSSYIIATLAMTVAVNSLAQESSQRLDEGQRAYEAACASCHDSGVGGAPVTHKPGDWKTRSPLWDAVLFEHANAGYLKMPSKGGRENLTEYDVDAAAEYMLTITHPALPAD